MKLTRPEKKVIGMIFLVWLLAQILLSGCTVPQYTTRGYHTNTVSTGQACTGPNCRR